MLPDTTMHVLHLVSVALDEFESVPLPATVRRAWRVARLRGDSFEALRFPMELGLDDEPGVAEPSLEIAALRVSARATFAAGRSTDVEARRLGLDTIEALTMQPLDVLVRTPRAYEDELSLRSRIEHANRRLVADSIVARVSNDVFHYLMGCETTLRLSATGERVFDRHRERVDRLLRAVAPDVLDMLNAAVRRAADGDDAEARAHALTSCRRVIAEVANHVFPARDEPYVDAQGTRRQVGPSHYRNRIVAAVETAGSATHHRALAASVDEFAIRLERLDELTQKGVHARPTMEDLDFGVIQTYLVAGEVLALTQDGAA